ncbi:MAG: hypothetical protein WD176_07885, partial [Pirellulales bacterium]
QLLRYSLDTMDRNGTTTMQPAAAHEQEDQSDAAPTLEADAWSVAAPRGVIEAARAGDQRACWRRWSKYLASRLRPVALEALLPRAKKRCDRAGELSPLLWALSPSEKGNGTAELVQSLTRGEFTVHRLRQWLSEMEHAPETASDDEQPAPRIALAIESLAWCHALPKLAAVAPAGLWWRLLRRLLRSATDAEAIDGSERPLEEQLLAGELPLALAYQFPEIAACAALAPSARHVLARGPAELLNPKGTPTWFDLPLTRPLLACWTRAHAMNGAMCDDSGDGLDAAGYQRLVRSALRLSRSGGSQIFSPQAGLAEPSFSPAMFLAALDVAGDAADRRLARKVLPEWKRIAPGGRSSRRAALPKSSFHCRRSKLAVLRSRWSRKSPRFALVYGNRQLQIDVALGRETLLLGQWTLRVVVDGQAAEPEGEWREIGWVSRRKATYAEFELKFSGGRRVQRHVVLGHRDRFLFLADAILGDEPAEIEYEAVLPLAAGARFLEERESREGTLASGKTRLRILPLALPEWRADPRGGILAATGCGVALRQKTYGANLFAPLWIDLKRGRRRQESTWRPLTVAEHRRVQRADEAVGYRVQVGEKQWLVYRSLTPVQNRTVLGHNLVTSFLVGRFSTDGTVKQLIEIE